jgi:ubiquinone/menaquinone biosynthesis C-methylase UbiE
VGDRVEILSVALLDRHREIVRSLRRLAGSLRLEFGWHYLLDLTWMIACLGEVTGKQIMDAGAGTGILQWYLAGQGAQVLSVDRESRAGLPLRFRLRYRVSGLRAHDLLPAGQAPLAVGARGGRPSWRAAGALLRLAGPGLPRRFEGTLARGPGKVVIYNQDLKELPEVPDSSLDAVVAVSSLEHNDPADLERVVVELMRVLKPGGALLATLGASPGEDWFHEPSRGWCYGEATLRQAFALSPDTPSNYSKYEELFAALRSCRELRDHLASFYSRSGENGMPWGVWDPRYQPVGVCKVKRDE